MTDYDPKKTVVIVGYPRSGNTWLARMIAEVLDSPLSRFREALPIGVEGRDRKGCWFVTQLHLKPVLNGENGDAICNAWEFNVEAWDGEKVILIVRDPRDVAISARYYWELESNRVALEAMAEGLHPLAHVGKWNDFYMGWVSIMENFVNWLPIIRYEDICVSPVKIIRNLVHNITGVALYDKNIKSVVARQEFNTKKEQISKEVFNSTEESRPYGKTIQLKAMRKGVPYQWKDEMSIDDRRYAKKQFGEVMRWMEYLRT